MDGFHEGPYNVIQRFIRPVPGGLLEMELRVQQQNPAMIESLKNLTEPKHSIYAEHYRLDRPVPFYISLLTTNQSGTVSDVLLMYNRGNIKLVVPDTTAIRALSDWALLLKRREASPLDSAFQWDEKVFNHCDVFDRAGNYVMD